MTSEEIRTNILQQKPFTVEMKVRQSVYRIAETLGVQAKCRKAGINCYEVIIIGTPRTATAREEPTGVPSAVTRAGSYLLWPPTLQDAVGEERRWRRLGDSYDDYPFLRNVSACGLTVAHRELKYAARIDESYHPTMFIPTSDEAWKNWMVIDDLGQEVSNGYDLLFAWAAEVLSLLEQNGVSVERVRDYVESYPFRGSGRSDTGGES